MVEPIMTAVATALATKAATGLYDLVKKAFARNPKDAAALAAATGAEPDSPQVAALAESLAAADAADPEFAATLRAEWARVSQHADHGGVTNQVSGTVTGNVVQARDIHGNISF